MLDDLDGYEEAQEAAHRQWEANLGLRVVAFSMPGHDEPGSDEGEPMFGGRMVFHPEQYHCWKTRISTLVTRHYKPGTWEFRVWPDPTCFYADVPMEAILS